MTNHSLLIASHLNHSFIESQLRRANDYDAHLCVIKFELRFDPKEGEKFQDIMGFMYSFLDYSPIVYEGGEHFLVFLHESKLHNVVLTIKNMIMGVKLKYGVNIHNIGVTAYDQTDDKLSLMERLHRFFMKSKISKEIDIYYGTKFFDYSHAGDFNNIKSVITTEPNLNLYGFYKESPLMSKVEILNFNNGIMQIRSNKEYLLFLKKQEFVYIEHTMIPDIMRAEITNINFNSGVIELNNLKFLDNSPVHRKNIRVAPHRPIQATLEFEGEFHADGLIADISKNAILLTTQLAKIEELQTKGLKTKSFTLKFHLDGANASSSSIEVRAMIYKVFGNQIVLNIYPTKEFETVIVEYIAMCQNLLLLEVRGTFVQ